MLRATGGSVVGPAHMQSGQPTQDALSLRGWCGGWIAAVADGLGSKKFSAQGARWAVQCAQFVLRNQTSSQLTDRDTVTAIYRRWLAGVPNSDPGNFATTLLVAACNAAGYVRIFQIGDGLILARTSQGLHIFTPEKAGFGNQTLALGPNRSWSAWTTGSVQLNQPGDQVLLMTDGIADDVDAGLLDPFADTIQRQIKVRTRRAGRVWLNREMTHWGTPGHSDDKTIAMIFKG
jgi:serine/threonine protein phosphatase PrpC